MRSHTSALPYISIKQSSLKILKYSPLFLQGIDYVGLEQECYPHTPNLELVYCYMTLSEDKN